MGPAEVRRVAPGARDGATRRRPPGWAFSEQTVANYKFELIDRLRAAVRKQGLPEEVFPSCRRHAAEVMFRQSDLEAFLDEALPAEEMSRIEQALRGDAELARRLAGVHARRDAGVAFAGRGLAAASAQLSVAAGVGRAFLLGALPEEAADYIAFHVEAAGCRYCQAKSRDLEARRAEPAPGGRAVRRRRYFHPAPAIFGPAK